MNQESQTFMTNSRPSEREANRSLSRMEMEQVLGALLNAPPQSEGLSAQGSGVWAQFTEEELEKLLGMELARFFGGKPRTVRPISN